MNANSKSHAGEKQNIDLSDKKITAPPMGRAFTVTVWNLGHFTAKAEFLSVAFILRSTPFTPLKNIQISASLF